MKKTKIDVSKMPKRLILSKEQLKPVQRTNLQLLVNKGVTRRSQHKQVPQEP